LAIGRFPKAVEFHHDLHPIAYRFAELLKRNYAFKIAAIACYYVDMEKKTAAYFDSRDLHLLKNLSSKSAIGRAVHEHEEFSFSPATLSQRALNLHNARRLPLAFENSEGCSRFGRRNRYSAAVGGVKWTVATSERITFQVADLATRRIRLLSLTEFNFFCLSL
jgi:hypothetical protein